MKRINKLIQQRRHQVHVHMPPSGLEAAPYGAFSATVLSLAARETEAFARPQPSARAMPRRADTLARS